MSTPDPATTEWVPIWHPNSEGPVGPAGPPGEAAALPTAALGQVLVSQGASVPPIFSPDPRVNTIALGTNPPDSGGLRLANHWPGQITGRNAANTANIDLLRANVDDTIVLGMTGTPLICKGVLFTEAVFYSGGAALPNPTETHDLGRTDLKWKDAYLSGNVNAGGSLYEKGRTVPMGTWIAVPFNASDFTADGATWTVTAGNVLFNQYTLIGNTMVWSFGIGGTTLSAATGGVYIKMPGGFTSPQNGSVIWKPGYMYSATIGVVQDSAAAVQTAAVNFHRGGNVFGAGAFEVYASVMFPIN